MQESDRSLAGELLSFGEWRVKIGGDIRIAPQARLAPSASPRDRGLLADAGRRAG